MKKDLQSFCVENLQAILEQTKKDIQKLKKQWEKAKNYYNGNQRGFWDTTKSEWVWIELDNLTPTEQSLLVINNQLKAHVRTLAKEFVRSLTKIKIHPKNDTTEATYASKLAQKLAEHFYNKCIDEVFKQTEARLLILTGNAFRYFYFKNQKTNQKDKQLSNVICLECNNVQQNNEQCQTCGSINLQPINLPISKTHELCCELVDPEEVIIHPKAKSFEQSPFLIRHRKLEFQILLNLTEEAKKLNYNRTQEVNFYEVWLLPSLYYDLELETKYKQYPKGTKYTDIFPDGIYFSAVERTILDEPINERFLNYWTHVIYDTKLDCVYGAGIEDAIQTQQLINELSTLMIENTLYNASPMLIINPRLINPASLTGRPRDVILMNDNALLDTKPNEAFASIPSQPIAQDVYAIFEGLKRDMREQTGAYLAFNATGDPNITTATGASIARDSALALISLSLALRAEADKQWIIRLLKLIQTYYSKEDLRFLLGKYSELELNSFYLIDVESDLEFTIENSSWQPATTYERIQNLMSYLSAFGIPFGFANEQIPPAIKEYANSLFQVPVEIDSIQPDIRVANKRLQDAKQQFKELSVLLLEAENEEQLEEISKSIVDSIILTMSPDIELDNHQIIADTYIRALKSDEGLNWHPLFRVAVREVVNMHKQILAQIELQKLQKQAIIQSSIQNINNQQSNQQAEQTAEAEIPAVASDLEAEAPEPAEQIPVSPPPYRPLSTVPVKPVSPISDFVGDEDEE